LSDLKPDLRQAELKSGNAWFEIDVNSLTGLYKQNASYRQIADSLNRTEDAVDAKIRELKQSGLLQERSPDLSKDWLSDYLRRNGDPKSFEFDKSRNITTVGVVGWMDAGKTIVGSDLVINGAQVFGIGMKSNNPISYNALKSESLGKFKDFCRLPCSDTLLWATLIDEGDKLLGGRNYSTEYNKNLSKLLGDVRRKGIPVMVITFQARKGLDTNARQNLHYVALPMRECWLDPETGLKYPLFWIFNGYDDFEFAVLNKKTLGKNYEKYATLYRSHLPLSILETVYNKNYLIPLEWNESFSDAEIAEASGKFVEWAASRNLDLSSFTKIKTQLLRWAASDDYSATYEGLLASATNSHFNRLLGQVLEDIDLGKKPEKEACPKCGLEVYMIERHMDSKRCLKRQKVVAGNVQA
jgi:hypothetical protein